MFRVATALVCVVGAIVVSAWFVGWGSSIQAADAQANTSEPTQQKIDEVRKTFQRQRAMLSRVQDITASTAFHEPRVNETAAMALGRIGFAAVEPLANALQRSTDSEVRFQVTVALAYIGPNAEAAIPQLTAALQDENVAVRRGAARALGQIGPAAASAVPSLIQILRDTAYTDQPNSAVTPAENTE